MQMDNGLPHKQTTDSSDWQSHLLYVSSHHRKPPRLCAQPTPVHTVQCTPMTALTEYSVVRYADDTAIIGHIINNDQGLYQKQIINLTE